MGMRRLNDGEDFGAEHFAQEKNFGFSGSAQGPDKHPAAPPFAGSADSSGPHHAVESTPAYACGGEAGGSAHNYAGGGHVHPHGHEVVKVDHGMHGTVMHHAHGGFTHIHPDGHMSHHGHDGKPAMPMMGHGGGEGPGEGTFVAKQMAEKAAGGESHMAHGGMKTRIPHSMKPKGVSNHSPIETPPRHPQRQPSARNEMPAGQMPMGVQPSAEADDAGSDQGMTQLRRGGRAR